jgi:hypothetical protein
MSSEIITRKSQPTKKSRSSMVTSYDSSNLLNGVWPFIRGRRWATGWAISSAYNLRTSKSSKGSKKGSSDTYYGTMLYGFALGPISLVHCIKSDGVTVWKDTDGVAISGSYLSLDTDVGTMRLYKGSWTQSVDAATYFADGPAYRGRVYAVLINWKLGSEDTSEPSVEIEGTFGTSTAGLVSPATVIEEAFTDKRIGLGASASLFSCEDGVVSATIKLAPKFEDETTIGDLCDNLLPLVWCYGRYDGAALSIQRCAVPPSDWDADTEIPYFISESVTALMAQGFVPNCFEPVTIKPETPEERNTQTIVNWTLLYTGDKGDDTEGEYTQAASYADPVVLECGGKTTTVDASAIITESVAEDFTFKKHQQLRLSQTTGTCVFSIDLYDLDKTDYMSPIKVYDRISATWLHCRVTSRTIKDDGMTVEIEWQLDHTSLLYASSTCDSYEDPTFVSYAPVDPLAVRIVELPRPLASQAAVGILCARGNETVNGFGAYCSIDAGANYAYVDNYKGFAVYGTLSAALTTASASAVMTGVTVDADKLDSSSSAQAAADTILGFIDDEIVSISTITEGTEQLTISILRGRLGTAIAAHDAGAAVYLIKKSELPIVTSPITEPYPLVDTTASSSSGTTYLFHLPQRIALNTQVADDCDDVSVTVAGEYSRPLPPESVTASSTIYSGAAMAFTVSPTTWTDEGYPAADFYDEDDLYVVPVIVYGSTRTGLSKRSKGSSSVTVTAAEIASATGSATTGTFDIQFYSYVSGRHSKTGTAITITISIF